MKMSLMTRRAGAQLRDVMCLSLWSFCLAAGSCARRRMMTVGLSPAPPPLLAIVHRSPCAISRSIKPETHSSEFLPLF